MNVSTGGIGIALNSRPAPEIAIVAVGVEQLASVTTQLIESGTRSILLEKPLLHSDKGTSLYYIADASWVNPGLFK